jgi:hypothetical protein
LTSHDLCPKIVAGSLLEGIIQAAVRGKEAIRRFEEMRRPECRFENKIASVRQSGKIKAEGVSRELAIGGCC